MDIKTESIIDIIELQLNKTINNITKDDLNKVSYLRISQSDLKGIREVDFNDLDYFSNIKELSIEGCMISTLVLNKLTNLKQLSKLSFINCDFIDIPNDYFENLKIEELVLINDLGLSNIHFSNINVLTIKNITFNFTLDNVNVLDISSYKNNTFDISKWHINELIINESIFNEDLKSLKCKITIKNDYDEIVKVIQND